MAVDPRVVDLLLEWEERREQGQDVSAAELCKGCPELLAEIEKGIVALKAAVWMQPDVVETLSDVRRDTRAPTVPWPSADPDYEILEEVGRGGMGVVYKARQRSLNRIVALKVALDSGPTPSGGRFFREAQITGQLEHPGIVPVHALAQRADHPQAFYVMRLVKGHTLSQAARAYHQRRGTNEADSLEFLSLVNAFVMICNTIAYAHSRGIIHRDLKGQNIVLGDFGEVVVLDWGLAKVLHHPDGVTASPAVGINEGEITGVQLSVQGQAIGTPAFMAPEQATGNLDQIGFHTDIYGLGAVLYEILTGEPPFSACEFWELLQKVCQEEPLPPRTLWPEVPADLEKICARAMAKNQADRYGSASELAQRVQRWQELQRKRAEQAVRESEAFYRSLVESLPQSIVRKDLQGRFTYVNRGACQMLGRPLEEILGKTDHDIFPPDLAEKYRADDKLVLESRKALEAMEVHQTVGGTKKYVQTKKTPVYDSFGEAVGSQVIFWDVTDRRDLEAALERATAELARVRERATHQGLGLPPSAKEKL